MLASLAARAECRLLPNTAVRYQKSQDSPLRRALKRRAQRAALRLPLSLEFERNQQADYYCEQRQTLDQSSYDQHSSLDFA